MSDEKITDSIKYHLGLYSNSFWGETIVSDGNSIQKLVENFKKMREVDMASLGRFVEEQDEKQKCSKIYLKKLKCGFSKLNEELINMDLGNLAKELVISIQTI